MNGFGSWERAIKEERWSDAMAIWIAEKRADGTFNQTLPNVEKAQALLAIARFMGVRV